MGNRTAKFISALIGSIVAGAPIAAVSQNAPAASSAANAAADCLASPKGIAPQGQHWYYRVERSTKRQCWYLRAEGGKDNAKDSAKPVQTAADTPAADAAAPPQRAVQDARAEYVKPQQTAAAPAAPAQAVPTTPAPTQQAANPSADSSAQQPAVASPWPDASAATSPAPEPAPAPVATPGTKASKSPALAAADSSTYNPAGSLQMVLLVIGGALALAGVLASIIYRVAGRRTRQADRRAHWDDWEPQDENPGRAPWLDDASRAQKAGPVDFDAVRPQIIQPQAAQLKAAPPKAAQLVEFSSAIGRIAAHSAPARKVIADLDEADIFNGEFKIETSAPQFAANEASEEAPADRDSDEGKEDAHKEDAVDIDVITAMLERLAQEGPRLRQPSLEADLADFAQIPRGQSAARA
ncbi:MULTISPECIES: hypothetical protein [Bradyrhizobium]|uniref:hypothetical protein n=1 Tax=Bradyrhizobium TaxID=374 RepID=UPI0003F664D8|nr:MULTISPECIES: hypothetical protein [Bradyrhizobium]UFW53373.1 hypothetical protein BaraCB756_21095 [Bradyrhizobium arachidis]